MAYIYEHICTVKDPTMFDSLKFKSNAAYHNGKPYDIVYGTKDGESFIQAYHYRTNIWTKKQAKAHSYKYEGKTFEPALVRKRYTDARKLPEEVRQLPSNAQTAWMLKYNAYYGLGSSKDEAAKSAWTDIKEYYEFDDEKKTWKVKDSFKKKCLEQILFSLRQREELSMEQKIKKKITYVAKDSGQGTFRIHIPMQIDDKGFTKTLKDQETGQYFLKGIATHTGVDKEDEHPALEFIEKNRDTVLACNVFADHDHRIKDTIGFVSDVGGEEGILEVTTALQNPEDNPMVKTILDKIEHGINLGYSIGGRVTKAISYYNENLKRRVTKFTEGIITEITVTPYASAYGTDVIAMSKSLDAELSKAIDTMVIESEEYNLSAEDLEENFWEDYERAVSKYSKEAKKQAQMTNINFMQVEPFGEDYAFEVTTSEDESASYAYVDYISFDKAWAKANLEGASDEIVDELIMWRKKLNLQSKTLVYADLKKAVVTSIAEALEAEEASTILHSAINKFSEGIHYILWSTELSKNEKIEALDKLTGELTGLISEYNDAATKNSWITIKNIALNAEEVEAMGKTKLDKVSLDDLKEGLSEEVLKAVKDSVTSIFEQTIEKATKEAPEEETKVTEEEVEEEVEKTVEEEVKEEVEEEVEEELEKETSEEPTLAEVLASFKTEILDIIESKLETVVSQTTKKSAEKPDEETAEIEEVEDNTIDVSAMIEEVVAKTLGEFFVDNPDIRVTGAKKSLITDSDGKAIDIEKMLTDEEAFKAQPADVRRELLASGIGRMLR